MHRLLRRGAPALLAALALAPHLAAQQPLDARYRDAANRLIGAALADSFAYNRLATMVDRFGNRLSGSASLEATIDWAMEQMRADGLQNVHGEAVMVPHWVRGEESAELVLPRAVPLHMIGLGGSVATPPGGITADVIVVGSEQELAARGAEARGKIILFDVPFTTYGETVRWRTAGALAAAKAGAVAALIRSVSSFSMQNPHTGSMRYPDSTVARIPGAAVSVEDAMMLHRMQARGERIRVHLTMGARTLPDAPSRNVVAEIVGSERPDEVVVISGHLDSWDVGTGAMDDGGGSVAAWEAVRLMHRLGLRPRRTVRVVLWTNEENGTRGGQGYRDQHRGQLDRHMLAIESDNGVFRPNGFRFQGSDAALATLRQIARLLEPIGATKMDPGEGEADVGPMIALGVPGLGLDVDGTRYFWYHHSSADTLDKLDPQEMARCVAAMAVMAYVVADMPESLPHQVPAAR
ncbi:M28 family metallopeptidase [Longimicrobium sp.]|uniref:M28 family metallopeptidase n=1 Tax=Longimicrobium sp. TaxID=2029185 RepID=UPI002BADA2A7|nr:M28 family metallopeptidase [Longimicrobium sp.]HSU15136.1 M28 family metallopeptidase [Longimicrobium sp.]